MARDAFLAATASRAAGPSITQRWAVLRPRLVPYAFIAPNLLLFTTFVFLPMVYAVYISFHRWTIIGEPVYIGVANYRRLAFDPLFWQALKNTVVYSLGTVPASMALGLILAV